MESGSHLIFCVPFNNRYTDSLNFVEMQLVLIHNSQFLLMRAEQEMSYLFGTLILSQSAQGLPRHLSMDVENEKF